MNRLISKYNWQHKNWPSFDYNTEVVSEITPMISNYIGEMSGIMQSLTDKDQTETLIRLITTEAISTSAIEGEILNKQDLMSSIKNNLGVNTKAESVKDKKAKAIAELMISVRNEYSNKLTITSIKKWHKLLFLNSQAINAGKWRSGKEPMQVVSGRIGKEIVHFEAPPSERVAKEMKLFTEWYNAYKITDNMTNAIVKSAITHLYFESIHPFEDGNGRIGRAIAEKCFSQSLGRPVYLSLSSIIERNKKQYYLALKEAQGSLHINNWIVYFANIILQSQKEAIRTAQFALKKIIFLNNHALNLNEREQKVVNKMLEAGLDGFEGGMTAKKYMKITKSSKATATRDLQHLTELGVFNSKGNGRNIHYELTI